MLLLAIIAGNRFFMYFMVPGVLSSSMYRTLDPIINSSGHVVAMSVQRWADSTFNEKFIMFYGMAALFNATVFLSVILYKIAVLYSGALPK